MAGQNPIPAQAFAKSPSLQMVPLEADANGNILVSASSPGVEQCVETSAAVISNGLTLFNIAGDPIEIVDLVSICQGGQDTTASTLQYESTGTLGSTTQTISGASASLASVAAGTSVVLQGTALSTAPIVNANGAGLGRQGSIVVPAGAIKAVVGVGTTVGTWKHYLRFKPLGPNAVVTAAF